MGGLVQNFKVPISERGEAQNVKLEAKFRTIQAQLWTSFLGEGKFEMGSWSQNFEVSYLEKW